jgi:hypothetical protein
VGDMGAIRMRVRGVVGESVAETADEWAGGGTEEESEGGVISSSSDFNGLCTIYSL